MISPNTLTFLAELSENNNREWFTDHKQRYEDAREDVLAFTRELIKGLSSIDSLIPSDLDPKTCVMRIYRDVRFSKNKAPYKNNFGIGISRNGKNFDGAGYYLHISPKECFLAAGSWMPEPDMLKAIRQEIDYNGSDFRAIVQDPAFLKYFGEPDQEAVLKTTPKGYDANHPDLAYLKLKSFTYSKELKSKDLTSPHAIKTVLEGFKKVHPFMVFLRNAIS